MRSQLLSIITEPKDFTPENISRVERMVKLAVSGGYLLPRPASWVKEMIQNGSSIGLRDVKGKIAAWMVLRELLVAQEEKIGFGEGAVWIGGEKIAILLREAMLAECNRRFAATFIVINHDNINSLAVWRVEQAFSELTPTRVTQQIRHLTEWSKSAKLLYNSTQPVSYLERIGIFNPLVYSHHLAQPFSIFPQATIDEF
ncbi:MAG: hypothetical protein HQL69_02420 [Magnetococcales bacterium]|nr:hypothetical protein [Magnetococcales bacterium]